MKISDAKPVSAADTFTKTIDGATFVLRPLKVRESNRIQDIILSSLQEKITPVATVAYQALKYTLIGCDGIVNGEGEPVEFKKDADGCVSDELLLRLPLDVKIELSNAVTDKSNITEEDAKN